MSVESEIDATTARAKAFAANCVADDLDRLCCAETEGEFFKYVGERIGLITALLRRGGKAMNTLEQTRQRVERAAASTRDPVAARDLREIAAAIR